MPKLTLEILKKEAQDFSREESRHKEKSLFGITDGKAVGTYLEHKFKNHLRGKYQFEEGCSASGIDFPGLNVDMKVTSISQPQSSSPYKSARQKVYGLGYSLLIFVYDKKDYSKQRVSTLNIRYTIFVESERTADYHMTKGLMGILENDGNADDLMAFMLDKMLPLANEDEARRLAAEILANPPKLGFLTISNASQWRLQYARVIDKAGVEDGVVLIYRAN